MKIGLGLIVRNEEIDLPRCLITFLPQVDYLAIVDTGSTDKTLEVAQTIINENGKHLLGYTLRTCTDHNDNENRLCNFGEARNEYIKDLKMFPVDYIMSCDADDSYLKPHNLKQYIKENPSDVYNFKYWLNDKVYMMSFKMWKADKEIKYVGRVHEYLHFNWEWKILESAIEIKHHVGHHEGQENGSERNIRILKNEIYPPLRSLFYWANENVDTGNYPEAIKWYVEYIRRAKNGEPVWVIELAHCYWRAARWINHLGQREFAKKLCLELLERDPSWSEAWCELAYISQLENDIPTMKKYALKALENKFVSRLFSEQDKYTSVPENMLLFCDAIEKKMVENKT